ncbi:MAG: Ig-like domain-containing protein [Emcibacteraceae bacterium]
MRVYFLLKNKLFLTAILICSISYSQNQIAHIVLPNLGGDDNLLLEQELIAQEPAPLLMPSTTPLFDNPTTSISTGSQVINFGDTAAGVSIGASSTNLKFQDEDYLARLGIEYASPNSNFGYGISFDAATLITSSFALGINAKGYSNLKEIVLDGVWIPENSHWKMKLSTAYMWGNRNFNFYSGSENSNLNQASYFFSANYIAPEEISDYIHTFGLSNWGSKANQTNLGGPVYVISENISTMDPLKLSTGTLKGASLDTQLGITKQIVTQISLGYESIEFPFSDRTQELDNVFFQNYLVQYQPTQEIILQADYMIGAAENNISLSASYGQWQLSGFKNNGNNGVLSNQGILLTYGIALGGQNNVAPLNILARPNDIRSGSLALRDAMTRPVQLPQNFLAKVDSTATTTTTLTVAEATPTLTGFALSITSVAYGASPPTITPPSSDSGGAITYTSSDTAVATVTGSTITLVGAGTTTFTATQAADGDYTSATTTTTLTVTGTTPTLTGFALSSASVAYGASAPTITPPSSASGGAITYTSSNTAVATVSGSTITLVGAGSTTFTATQAADGNYTSASTTTTLIIANSPYCFNSGTIVYEFFAPYYSCSCTSGYTGASCEDVSLGGGGF